jgi:hypothetical protein
LLLDFFGCHFGITSGRAIKYTDFSDGTHINLITLFWIG